MDNGSINLEHPLSSENRSAFWAFVLSHSAGHIDEMPQQSLFGVRQV